MLKYGILSDYYFCLMRNNTEQSFHLRLHNGLKIKINKDYNISENPSHILIESKYFLTYLLNIVFES